MRRPSPEERPARRRDPRRGPRRRRGPRLWRSLAFLALALFASAASALPEEPPPPAGTAAPPQPRREAIPSLIRSLREERSGAPPRRGLRLRGHAPPLQPPPLGPPPERPAWGPLTRLSIGARLDLGVPVSPAFALDASLGAVVFPRGPDGLLYLQPAVSCSFDQAWGRPSGHSVSLGLGVGVGSLIVSAAYTPRALLDLRQGVAAGLRHGLSLQVFYQLLSVEIYHDVLFPAGEARHALQVMLCVNPVGFILLYLHHGPGILSGLLSR